MHLDGFGQLSCRKHTPHNVCQQMSHKNKYKYLCDATFLNASAAHAVYKEFLKFLKGVAQNWIL